MSTLAQLPWDLNQVRPEVTSGLVTVAAEGCLEFVKCTEPENRTAAVECCYGTPKRTQASRTPLCISEREDKPTPVQDRHIEKIKVWIFELCQGWRTRDAKVLNNPSWTGLHCWWNCWSHQVPGITSHRCPGQSCLPWDVQWLLT